MPSRSSSCSSCSSPSRAPVALLGPALLSVGLLGQAGCRRDTPRTPATVSAAQALDVGEPQGALTFISERSGNRDVYFIRADGRDERPLATGPAAEYNGPSTPDGTQLLVTSAEGEQQWFSLVPLPKTDARPDAKTAAQPAPPAAVPIGPRRGSLLSPRFSPDGSRIYFESESTGYRDLFCLNREAGTLTQLTSNPEGNFAPALSPRGTELAFVSSRDRVAELYLMPASGGPARRLTTTGRDEWQPEWAPQGGWLVFGSDRDGADRLYLLPTADTEHAKSLSGDDARRVSSRGREVDTVEQQPSFSPDGRRLAYAVRRRGQPSRIEIVPLDAAFQPGPAVQLDTPADQDASEPVWSSDGRFLAFSLGRGPRGQIYRVRASGEGLTPVTSHASLSWHPRWTDAR